MLDAVLHGLAAAVPELGATVSARGRPEVIKVGSSPDRPSFLVFDASGARPRCHLKLGRTPERRRALEDEHATLRRLAAIGALRGSVPEPLALFPVAEWLVLAQRGLPGTPLSVGGRRRRRAGSVRTDVHRALAWLRSFQAATAAGASTVIDEKAVHDTLVDSGAGLPPAFVRSVLAAAEHHAGLRLPLVDAHGDYWAGNVLVDRDRVGVVDWEAAGGGRSPVADLFFFLLTYALWVPGSGWRIREPSEALLSVLHRDGWLRTLAGAEVRASLSAAGLPASSAHLLGALFLLEQAATAPRLRAADPGKGDWAELLRVYAADHERSVLYELQDTR